MMNRKNIFIGIIISAVFLSAAVFYRAYFYIPSIAQSGLKIEKIVIRTASGKEHVFGLEVAESTEDIRVGLMHRASMPSNRGMIFLMGREPKDAAFWMKNTLIPLDMLFVAQDGTIVRVHEKAEPLSLAPIRSGGPVTAVIELNGGRAAEAGIKAGDRVIYQYFQ